MHSFGVLPSVHLLVGFVVAMFLVWPLQMVAHELGHAVAALRAAPYDRVHIVLGASPPWVFFESDRLRIAWSPRRMKGAGGSAFCSWNEAAASNRDRFLVCLAGPLVDFASIPVFVLAMVACLGLPNWIPSVWGASALIAFISVLINLDPRTTEAHLGSPERDGPKALAAYRSWRAELRDRASRLES
jgi:hypothetical protein